MNYREYLRHCVDPSKGSVGQSCDTCELKDFCQTFRPTGENFDTSWKRYHRKKKLSRLLDIKIEENIDEKNVSQGEKKTEEKA